MTNLKSYSWVKKLDKALLEVDAIPLASIPLEFDWQEFSQTFAKSFHLSEISIKPFNTSWKKHSEMLQSMGEDIISLAFTLSPISDPVFFIMSQSDVAKLCSCLLFKTNKRKDFASSDLQEGFYRFAILKALNQIEKTDLFEDFSLKMVENVELKDAHVLCVDIQMQFEKVSCFATLCIPPSFRSSWQKHFTNKLSPIEMLNKSYEIPLLAQAGQVELSPQELNAIEAGDFILLDPPYWDPKTHKGLIKIAFETTPLFYAKVKQNEIKLIDFAYLQEETTMENNDMPEAAEEPSTAIKTQEALASSMQDVPTCITVEVARFRMPLGELLKLQPGNLLELPVHPEQEVDLSINGQKIGQAELIHLGEALGIRITQIKK